MTREPADNAGAELSVHTDAGRLTLTLSGRLDVQSTSALWNRALDALAQSDRPPAKIIVDAARLIYCDGAGMGLLLELRRRAGLSGQTLEITGLNPDLERILQLYSHQKAGAPDAEAATERPVEEIGRAAVGLLLHVRDLVAFLGELLVELAGAVRHPARLRWGDAALTVEKAGANALPIVTLLGGLFGLILAFQSAVPLKRFAAAEVYTVDLVAIALLRELGPILTAIILAGRSGGAFAAELGTMKVNEEISALRTMGLSPVRFLVLPRVAGGMLVTPLLTIFCDLVGLVGAAAVMLLFGYPVATSVSHVTQAVGCADLLGGLLKATVFGLLISAVGCKEGLATGTGPSAVGQATTRAVVAGFVLIIVADGAFAIVSYSLGV